MSSFWARLLGREQRDSLENPSTDLIRALTGLDELNEDVTGIPITPEKALRYSAVYAAVRLLAEDAASLPFPVYRRKGDSRWRVADDPRSWILNDEANPEMTAMELRETTVGHANLWGRGHQYIERHEQTGELLGLWPLRPDRTREIRIPKGAPNAGARAYAVTLDTGETRILLDDEVLTVRAFLGLSPIELARRTIALALAAEEFGARFFSNDARPGGVIETNAEMDEDEARDFARVWQAGHRGLKRSHLVGILTNGATWREVGVAPEHAQFLETRQFEVQEVSRWFRIPASMLETDKGESMQYSTVEGDQLFYAVHALRPWLVRYEKATKRSLFSRRADRSEDRYPEFLVDGLLRGDLRGRHEAYAIALGKGGGVAWMTRNEVRARENLPAIDGGDDLPEPARGLSDAQRFMLALQEAEEQLRQARNGSHG